MLFFYRNAIFILSGIVWLDVPHIMSYSDLGDFCGERDHLVVSFMILSLFFFLFGFFVCTFSAERRPISDKILSMQLDYVTALHTELEEIMDRVRCYTPKIDTDSAIPPESMKLFALQRAKFVATFRRLRNEACFCVLSTSITRLDSTRLTLGLIFFKTHAPIHLVFVLPRLSTVHDRSVLTALCGMGRTRPVFPPQVRHWQDVACQCASVPSQQEITPLRLHVAQQLEEFRCRRLTYLIPRGQNPWKRCLHRIIRRAFHKP